MDIQTIVSVLGLLGIGGIVGGLPSTLMESKKRN